MLQYRIDFIILDILISFYEIINLEESSNALPILAFILPNNLLIEQPKSLIDKGSIADMVHSKMLLPHLLLLFYLNFNVT